MTTPTWQCALHHDSDIPRSRKKRDLCEDCFEGLAVRSLAWCSRGRHRVTADAMLLNGYGCRACERGRHTQDGSGIRSKAWRERNAEQVRAYRARPDVQERRTAYGKAYYRANRDRLLAYQHQHYQANRARYVANCRRFRATHPGYEARRRFQRKLRIMHSWRRAV